MGCDIHSYLEIRKDSGWELSEPVIPLTGIDLEWALERGGNGKTNHPFDWRSYAVFGFLADVRNYSDSPVISRPKDIPDDASEEVLDLWETRGEHTPSWLSLRELVEYDYDQTFEDRRDGEGTTTLRYFLGGTFFEQIEFMKTLGNLDDVRVVFWFDN